jgi:hypothetical protein
VLDNVEKRFETDIHTYHSHTNHTSTSLVEESFQAFIRDLMEYVECSIYCICLTGFEVDK